MNAQNKGTVEWFEGSRRRCIDHLRGLLSIKLARANAAEILRNWTSQSIETKHALHSACVISYARPFTQSATSAGKKITYPTRQLRNAIGFDKDLHTHILDLRNRIIAHGDYGIFHSTMYVQAIGDARLPIVLGMQVKSMCGIESRDLAQRYEAHLLACDNKLEELLSLECNELAKEAKQYPKAFDATHNIPEVRQDVTITGSDMNRFPGPIGPAATVENPSFPKGLSDYHYITLNHEIPLIESGEYVVKVDGVEQKITFSSKN
jgi:hypothetical protein